MNKPKSRAQRAATQRFPLSKVSFGDFSLAQGYATCYRELVEPLLELLEDAKQGLFDAGTRQDIVEKINATIAANG